LTYSKKDLFKALEGGDKHIAAQTGDGYYPGMLAETMTNALLLEIRRQTRELSDLAVVCKHDSPISELALGIL